MAKIEHLGSAYFKVSHVNSSARFYHDVLGLDLKFCDDDRWVAFDAGGTTVALMPAGGEPSPGAILAFHVDDIDAWVEEARERGLNVGPITEGPHERTADLRDPDGHRLVVYSPR